MDTRHIYKNNFPLYLPTIRYHKIGFRLSTIRFTERHLLGGKLIEIKFHIEGITCTGCAMDMENVLLGLSGVEEASLNYADGKFTIQYDPGEIEAEKIIKKVETLGFKTKLLKEDS